MKEIKNILKGSDGYIYLILSDGTTERTDAARLELIAAGDDWNEISETAKKSAEKILKDIARESERPTENKKVLYTIADCAEYLERTDAATERELPANRHYIIRDEYGDKIAINKRGYAQAIAEKLANKPANGDGRGINLKYYAWEWAKPYIAYDTPHDVTAREVTPEEAEEINKTLEYLRELSRRISRKCWYMIEWGNGYTEESAAAYNFFAMLEHAGRPDTLPAYVEQWARRIYPIEARQAAESVNRDAEYRERLRAFYECVYNIFEHCLTFNINLQIDNEKPGGIAEQEARKLIEKIGSYNNFSVNIFDIIVSYLNKYFLCT